jgi:DNA-directed RNA polymerase alpha subunit
MKEQYIKVSDFLKYCTDSAKVSRGLYHKCLDQAVKGPAANLSAAAYFDQQTMMYEYNIPNVIQNLELVELGFDEYDKMPVEAMDFSAKTYHLLKRNGIETVGELLEKYEFELIKIRNMGGRGLQEIKTALKERGLSLKGKTNNDKYSETNI